MKQIESAGAWMVLKQIETHPAYRALVEDTLMAVARDRGYDNLKDAGFEDLQGFIFVSSPNSTTPFHADSDENFFFQVHGEKLFYVYDNQDRSIASEEALEGVVAKHRNIPYDPKFDAKQTAYRLFPGDGIFVPYQWPHYVKTAGSYLDLALGHLEEPGRAPAATTSTCSTRCCAAWACRSRCRAKIRRWTR